MLAEKRRNGVFDDGSFRSLRPVRLFLAALKEKGGFFPQPPAQEGAVVFCDASGRFSLYRHSVSGQYGCRGRVAGRKGRVGSVGDDPFRLPDTHGVLFSALHDGRGGGSDDREYHYQPSGGSGVFRMGAGDDASVRHIF